MPFGMGYTVQSVVLGNKVYIGGGGTGSGRDACTVMVYDIQRDTYSTLPYNAFWFAMTALNDQLVLAGGRDLTSRKPTNQIAVLQSDKWTRPYPPMTIARYSSTAVSFNNHIIVAGGRDHQHRRISSVEVLDVTSNRWCIVDPLPVVRSEMKSVIVGDMCYIMGGLDHAYRKVVHSVNLRELTEKGVSMATSLATPKPVSLWQTEDVDDTPLFYSAPLVLKQSILAVGGHDDIDVSTSIHLYQSGTRRWVKVGDLPTARSYCTCSVLPNGQVLIAGGSISFSPLCRVDLLTVTESS